MYDIYLGKMISNLPHAFPLRVNRIVSTAKNKATCPALLLGYFNMAVSS